jgi:low temperature requirement protein LtrA
MHDTEAMPTHRGYINLTYAHTGEGATLLDVLDLVWAWISNTVKTYRFTTERFTPCPYTHSLQRDVA